MTAAASSAAPSRVARAPLALPGTSFAQRTAVPPAITPAERLARLAKARALMQRDGLGAILIEPGASLDYFTGVRWSRSERLTAALIPATGDPIIVTPFFEKPSVAESLAIPAEIRTWDEHEEPLKLVADWLRERKLTAAPLGIEETNRFFIVDRLQGRAPAARHAQRQCRRARLPDDQVAGRDRADAGRVGHHGRGDPRRRTPSCARA